MISTVAPKQTVLPVVVVDIPLSRRDIENVARAITMDEQHPIDKIAQFFFDEKLFINTAADSMRKLSIPYVPFCIRSTASMMILRPVFWSGNSVFPQEWMVWLPYRILSKYVH